MKTGIVRRRRRSRWLIAAGVTAIAVAGAVASWAALGGRAKGARLQRMQKSPEWRGSHFENPQPIVDDTWAAVVTLFRTDPNVSPHSLGTSEITVKAHRGKVMRKMRAGSLPDLVRMAERLGIAWRRQPDTNV